MMKHLKIKEYNKFLEILKIYYVILVYFIRFGSLFKTMTKLGDLFLQKSVNKSAISRKTGISSARLSELSRNNKTKIKAEELYLISLALEIPMDHISERLYGHLQLIK